MKYFCNIVGEFVWKKYQNDLKSLYRIENDPIILYGSDNGNENENENSNKDTSDDGNNKIQILIFPSTIDYDNSNNNENPEIIFFTNEN